jgi:hypothetical protein
MRGMPAHTGEPGEMTSDLASPVPSVTILLPGHSREAELGHERIDVIAASHAAWPELHGSHARARPQSSAGHGPVSAYLGAPQGTRGR